MKLSRAQKIQLGGQIKADTEPLRPPMTGWNTRDDFEGMEPTDAIIMDNWYADVGGLTVRNGTQRFTNALGGSVKTLAEFYSKTNRKFLAAAGGQVLDITAGGNGVSLGSGFGSDVWTTQNFKDRLFLANGANAVQVFDGTTLANAAFTGMPEDPVGVFLFKERLYFWLEASNSFYFAGVDAVTGAVTEFPLSTLAKFGGNIMLLTNFSHDGGDGIANLFCIVMTTGEIILYSGYDPTLAASWELTGIYKLAPPVSRRAVANYGADCYLTTFDDHLALQEQLVALKVGQAPARSKISGAVATALERNPDPDGYQAIFYSKGRRIMFNIPNRNGTYDQHVFNTSNQTWQRFRGMRATCWSEFNTDLYFGTPTGYVYQADIGTSDDGARITAYCQQAYNKMSTLNRKRVAGVRPVVSAVQGRGYTFYLGYDYKPLNLVISKTGEPAQTLWDVSMWDVSLWTPDNVISTEMNAAEGTGTAIGFAIQFVGTDPFAWLRTDLLVVPSNSF